MFGDIYILMIEGEFVLKSENLGCNSSSSILTCVYLCICVHFEKQKPLLQFSFPVHSSIAMFRKEFTLALPGIVIINNINNNSIININNNNNNIINNTNNCKVDIAIILNTWSPQSNNCESRRDHQQFVHWQRPPGKEGKEGTES